MWSRINGVYDRLETHLLYRKCCFFFFFSFQSDFYKDVVMAAE